MATIPGKKSCSPSARSRRHNHRYHHDYQHPRAGAVWVYAESLSSGVRRYLGWVQQPDPSTNEYPASTTAHIYRECRPDDRAFIDFVAPGIRWMDLKVPRVATLTEIKSFVEAAYRSGPS